jgi:phosphoribosylaminoimidazolecarboxamide formyltransferase / IMP cyclohydrolase
MCSFGDFVAISDIVDECTARVLKTEVCDGIIAPGYEPAALEILKAKKKGAFIVLEANSNYTPPAAEFREVMGVGFYQKRNDVLFTSKQLEKIVTVLGTEETKLSTDAQRDLVLASIAIKYTQVGQPELSLIFSLTFHLRATLWVMPLMVK